MSSRAIGSALRRVVSRYCYSCHQTVDFLNPHPTEDGEHMVLSCPTEGCEGTTIEGAQVVAGPAHTTEHNTHT